METSKILHQLGKASGFGSLRIRQNLPTAARVACDTHELQVAALRSAFDDDTLETQEEFVILLLDGDHDLIAPISIYKGTAVECGVNFPDVLKPALLAGAACVVIAHNHPNGNIHPSRADIHLSNRLAHALQIVELDLLDSYVVTRTEWYSLMENGLLRA